MNSVLKKVLIFVLFVCFYSGINVMANSLPAIYVITDTESFVKILKVLRAGDRVVFESGKNYDFSKYRGLRLPGKVTITSNDVSTNRPLIFSNNKSCNPLFITSGNDIKISNLRFEGPDGNYLNPEIESQIKSNKKSHLTINRLRAYGLPNSSFINVKNKGFIIENCEIFNWSYAGVSITNGGTAVISGCDIHNIRRFGLGYGVYLDIGYAEIKNNIFRYNRHSIAGSGRVGTSYFAHNNTVYQSLNENGHVFDMHGGVDRKDKTNIAGDFIKIENNTFYYSSKPVIKIRGIPRNMSIIRDNTFIMNSDNIKSNNSIIQQSGGKRGNLDLKNNKYK